MPATTTNVPTVLPAHRYQDHAKITLVNAQTVSMVNTANREPTHATTTSVPTVPNVLQTQMIVLFTIASVHLAMKDNSVNDVSALFCLQTNKTVKSYDFLCKFRIASNFLILSAVWITKWFRGFAIAPNEYDHVTNSQATCNAINSIA